MQAILATAEQADFEFLVSTLCGRWNLINDKALQEALRAFTVSPSCGNWQTLADQIEHELRYAGSSEGAYAWRWLTGQDPGVKINEIIDDVAAKLGVRCRRIGTAEGRLQSLARGVVEKTFLKLSPDEQQQILESQGVTPEKTQEVLARLKEGGKLAFLPLLVTILGKQVTARLVTNIAMQVITTFLGREAAKQVIGQMVTKFPWWAEWLGPIAWGISISWFGLDMQRPAFRITCPILVYLGIVSLRKGPEKGEELWQETDQ